MMLASAAHPTYFDEAHYKDVGSFISGDSVSISPSLFAMVVAEEGIEVDLAKVRIVNIGSTYVEQDKMPTDMDGKKEYMKKFLK